MRIPLLILFTFSQTAWATLRVTIDPGHGGDEKGAVHGGVVESQVALQISQKLFSQLQKDKNFDVQILRQKDETVELEDRVKKAEEFKTDLFVSIHANSSPSNKISGIEFYIQNQLPVDQETLFLAHMEHNEKPVKEERPSGDVDSIIYDLEKSHKILTSYQVSGYLRKKWDQSKKFPIRQGPFFVLSQSLTPAVLIEVGYLTNEKERRKLVQKDYQEEVVKKIHQALKDYSANKSKLPSGDLKSKIE